MAIQIRRGTDSEWESNKSNIVAGEPAVTLDSERMFVGTGSGTYMELANLDVLADAFDSSASYEVGDFVAYHGKVYKFNTDHSGAWNASDVDEVALADALDSLGEDVYTKAEADALLALKADASDVNSALALKADKSDTYTKAEGEAFENESNQKLDAMENQIETVFNNTPYGLFGARWNKATNLMTRIYGAEGITTDTSNFGHFGSRNANYDNPFDTIYPWSDCFVADFDLVKYRSGNYSLRECVASIYGDPDFTYEPSADRFVGGYRPEFWYAVRHDANGNIEFLVSQVEREGFKHHKPNAIGVGEAVLVDTNKVSAGSGVPLTNVAVSTIHTYAKNNGFTLVDIDDLSAEIVLYLVEYANMNSQQALGNGCSDCYRQNATDVIANVSTVGGVSVFDVTDSALNNLIQIGTQLDFGTSTGATTYKAVVKSFEKSGDVFTITLDRELSALANGMYLSVHGYSACEYNFTEASVGSASGYIGLNGKANAFYRGVNLYANRYRYILGIYRHTEDNHIWVCPDGVDADDYNALDTSVHEDTGMALPLLEVANWQTVGGNANMIENIAFLITGTSSGSSASPVGDQQYVPLATAGNTILLFGGRSNGGWRFGLFCGNWFYSASVSDWYYGASPVLKTSL